MSNNDNNDKEWSELDFENLMKIAQKVETQLDVAQCQRLERLANVSCIATFLRNASISFLTQEEKNLFLATQDYFIELEAQCYDEAGFQ